MKKRQKKNKILIITLAIIVVVLVSSGAAYALFVHPHQQNITDDKSGSQKVNEDTPNSPDKETRPNTDTPTPPVTNQSTGKQVVQMVSYAEVSNNTLFIRGGINNAVVNDGTCFAQLTGPNGQIIKEETSLLQNASTTDCKTISINTSALAKGVWKFTLNYSSDQVEGKSDEASFEIK